jgi:hypothetical protein
MRNNEHFPQPTGSPMKKSTTLKARSPLIFSALAGALVIGGLAATLCSAEPGSGAPTQTNSTPASAGSSGAPGTAAKQPLTGAELYSIHCNRCHPERYPTERTAAQWKTIMLHMQVRANIPGAQARQILKYLQENSGR